MLSEDEIRALVLAGFGELDVEFRDSESLEFYLAVPIDWSIEIAADKVGAVARALGAASLDEYFQQACFTPPRYDELGNVVWVPIGHQADIWFLDDLATFAGYVTAGSFILGQDDNGSFFRIHFDGSSVSYSWGSPTNEFIPERHLWMGIVDAAEESES